MTSSMQKDANVAENLYYMLQKKVKEKISCEICDKKFSNRYNSIVHNTKHIIIPLLRHQIHKCCSCHCAYISVDDLIKHMLKKHTTTSPRSSCLVNIVDSIKTNKLSKASIKAFINPTLTIDNGARNEIEPTIDNQVTVCDDSGKVTSDKPNDSWRVSIDKKVSLRDSVKEEGEYILPDVYYDVKLEPNTTYDDDKASYPVKREMSEQVTEVEVGKTIITPSSTFFDNKHYIDTFDTLDIKPSTCAKESSLHQVRVGSTPFSVNSEKYEPIWEQIKINVGAIVKHKRFGVSIHYDQLRIQGAWACQYCPLKYISRYCLILHETTHMRFIKPEPLFCKLCDRYVASPTIKDHIDITHPGLDFRTLNRLSVGICKVCNLKFSNYPRHERIYHGSLKQLEVPPAVVFTRICRTCLADVGASTYYGTTAEISSCQICNKWAMKMNIIRQTMAKNLKFEEEVKQKQRKKKCLSNMARLKNIQMRLKMINKLSKFYPCIISCHVLNRI
ncbi:unnamed protein product [Leptosia nina]|uniref:C2H2-type domain-containing protein n=1 Tax=Leptosia nina TaxID=320188 RepID=A0AAV1JLC1_9NEOP